jgi:hypothetical protein
MGHITQLYRARPIWVDFRSFAAGDRQNRQTGSALGDDLGEIARQLIAEHPMSKTVNKLV